MGPDDRINGFVMTLPHAWPRYGRTARESEREAARMVGSMAFPCVFHSLFPSQGVSKVSTCASALVPSRSIGHGVHSLGHRHPPLSIPSPHWSHPLSHEGPRGWVGRLDPHPSPVPCGSGGVVSGPGGSPPRLGRSSVRTRFHSLLSGV